MVFKKNDLKTKEAGKKGGLKTQERHPETQENLKLQRVGKPENFKKLNRNTEHQRKAGKMSRLWQNIAIRQMKNDYDKIFQPFRVCDYICIKDEQIIFVEIKRLKKGKKEKLRPLQEEFKNLCEKLGYRHEIIYIAGKRKEFEGGKTDNFHIDLAERFK